MTDGTDVEFFGAHIKVKNAKLAALLNSTLTDDVTVVGKRALDLVAAGERDDDVGDVFDGADERRDTAFEPDEPDQSLDRVFARRAPPSPEH